jgi:hypothetical protein
MNEKMNLIDVDKRISQRTSKRELIKKHHCNYLSEREDKEIILNNYSK